MKGTSIRFPRWLVGWLALEQPFSWFLFAFVPIIHCYLLAICYAKTEHQTPYRSTATRSVYPGQGRFVGHPFIRIGAHNAGVFITFDRASTKAKRSAARQSVIALTGPHSRALFIIIALGDYGLQHMCSCILAQMQCECKQNNLITITFKMLKLSINFPSNIRRGTPRQSLGPRGSLKHSLLGHCCCLL